MGNGVREGRELHQANGLGLLMDWEDLGTLLVAIVIGAIVFSGLILILDPALRAVGWIP